MATWEYGCTAASWQKIRHSHTPQPPYVESRIAETHARIGNTPCLISLPHIDYRLLKRSEIQRTDRCAKGHYIFASGTY